MAFDSRTFNKWHSRIPIYYFRVRWKKYKALHIGYMHRLGSYTVNQIPMEKFRLGNRLRIDPAAIGL